MPSNVYIRRPQDFSNRHHKIFNQLALWALLSLNKTNGFARLFPNADLSKAISVNNLLTFFCEQNSNKKSLLINTYTLNTAGSKD